MKNINFLDKEIVLYFHYELIKDYGGKYGVRDIKLLESALAQPKSTYNGKLLHSNIFEMASAYGFHICRNHPFIDGNKRIALVAMDIFLQINGWEINADEKSVYAVVLSLSKNQISKKELSKWLKENCIPKMFIEACR